MAYKKNPKQIPVKYQLKNLQAATQYQSRLIGRTTIVLMVVSMTRPAYKKASRGLSDFQKATVMSSNGLRNGDQDGVEETRSGTYIGAFGERVLHIRMQVVINVFGSH